MTRKELIRWAKEHTGAEYTISKVAEAVLEMYQEFKELVEETGGTVLEDE